MLGPVARNRIGAALLAAGSLTFLWYALSCLASGSGCGIGRTFFVAPALGLMALHATLALGVWTGRAWARWMGIGVGFAWVLCTSLIACAAPPAVLLFAALHAPLPLLLARQDDIHGRTSLSLLLTGMALPLALSLGLGELGLPAVSWALIAGSALVVFGAVGMARGRTWGLLLLGAAGLTYLSATTIDPIMLERQAFQISGLVALPLLAALVPFLKPMTAFLFPTR